MLIFAVPVMAQQAAEEEEMLSGSELLVGCEEGAAPGQPSQYCMRYVFGLVQTIDMLQQAEPGQKLFCIDPNVISLEEVTMKISTWLKGKSSRLNEDAYKLVSEALNAAYPCKLKGI